MKTFSIHKKVVWYVATTSSWEATFYPSLVKKIRKSDEFFNSIFEWKILPLSKVVIEDVFFPLYEKEIENRSNYMYERDQQKKNMYEKLAGTIKYFLFGFYLKDSGKFAGGLLYSEKSANKISVSLRTFDRTLRLQYSSVTSLDYWAEKIFFEEMKEKNTAIISHGTDNYPNIGRVGLPLFKLKVGGKAKISTKEHETEQLLEVDLLKSEKPVMFFDTPDKENFFTKAHLFYKEDNIDISVLGELIKVLEWANIPLELHKS